MNAFQSLSLSLWPDIWSLIVSNISFKYPHKTLQLSGVTFKLELYKKFTRLTKPKQTVLSQNRF